MSALSVRSLSVSLDHVPILHEVSCSVASGGWLALIGPNGAGKTTLLRAVAGLLAFRGEVLLDGSSVGSLRGHDRARLIAYVPQEPVLPPDMTVSEYIMLGRTPYISYLGGAGRSDRSAADSAASRLGVSSFAGRRLASLSGGERQRVVLARALAQEPRVLLLDEPTSSLDVGHQQQVLDLVDSLRSAAGLTVLSTLHDLTTAGQYADQLVLLDQGRIEAAGTAAEVLTEERIARVYSAHIAVRTDPDGSVVVTPVRARLPLVPAWMLGHSDGFSAPRDVMGRQRLRRQAHHLGRGRNRDRR
jgi:iron complex transport system ATP-binding protein